VGGCVLCVCQCLCVSKCVKVKVGRADFDTVFSKLYIHFIKGEHHSSCVPVVAVGYHTTEIVIGVEFWFIGGKVVASFHRTIDSMRVSHVFCC
jgi:hypothetical protein